MCLNVKIFSIVYVAYANTKKINLMCVKACAVKFLCITSPLEAQSCVYIYIEPPLHKSTTISRIIHSACMHRIHTDPLHQYNSPTHKIAPPRVGCRTSSLRVNLKHSLGANSELRWRQQLAINYYIERIYIHIYVYIGIWWMCMGI